MTRYQRLQRAILKGRLTGFKQSGFWLDSRRKFPCVEYHYTLDGEVFKKAYMPRRRD